MPPNTTTLIVTQLPPHLEQKARRSGKLADTFRWGVYTRISDDREGDEKGVGRQDADCTHAIEHSRGGHVARRYQENDTSAWKKRKITLVDADGFTYDAYRVIRPEFQAALRDLRDGVIDGLMIYDLDRLARDPRDLEDCIDVVERSARLIESYLAGELDLMSDNGCTMARVVVAMKNQASRDASRRIGRKHWETAKAGEPVGLAAWGWMSNRIDLHPDNSLILLEIIRLAIEEDRSPTQLCKYLDLQSVPTPRPAQKQNADRPRTWHRTSIETMLRNPRLCGLRTYKGQIMVTPDGEPVRGTWVALMDRERFDLLQSKIGVKKTRSYDRPGRHGRKYLFSGYLRCGVVHENGSICGSRMSGYTSRGIHRYGCSARNNGGCGGCSIDGPRTDALLTELVLLGLERRALEVATTDHPFPLADRLAELRLQQRNLAATMRSGQWTAPMDLFYDTINGLSTQIGALEEQEREWSAKAMITPEEGASARRRWESGDIDVRSAMIDKVFTHFMVRPIGRGPGFSPDRITPVSRTFPTSESL